MPQPQPDLRSLRDLRTPHPDLRMPQGAESLYDSWELSPQAKPGFGAGPGLEGGRGPARGHSPPASASPSVRDSDDVWARRFARLEAIRQRVSSVTAPHAEPSAAPEWQAPWAASRAAADAMYDSWDPAATLPRQTFPAAAASGDSDLRACFRRERAAADSDFAAAPAASPERWVCPGCEEPNKAERPECNNCGRRRLGAKDSLLTPRSLASLETSRGPEPSQDYASGVENSGWEEPARSSRSLDASSAGAEPWSQLMYAARLDNIQEAMAVLSAPAGAQRAGAPEASPSGRTGSKAAGAPAGQDEAASSAVGGMPWDWDPEASRARKEGREEIHPASSSAGSGRPGAAAAAAESMYDTWDAGRTLDLQAALRPRCETDGEATAPKSGEEAPFFVQFSAAEMAGGRDWATASQACHGDTPDHLACDEHPWEPSSSSRRGAPPGDESAEGRESRAAAAVGRPPKQALRLPLPPRSLASGRPPVGAEACPALLLSGRGLGASARSSPAGSDSDIDSLAHDDGSGCTTPVAADTTPAGAAGSGARPQTPGQASATRAGDPAAATWGARTPSSRPSSRPGSARGERTPQRIASGSPPVSWRCCDSSGQARPRNLSLSGSPLGAACAAAAGMPPTRGATLRPSSAKGPRKGQASRFTSPARPPASAAQTVAPTPPTLPPAPPAPPDATLLHRQEEPDRRPTEARCPPTASGRWPSGPPPAPPAAEPPAAQPVPLRVEGAPASEATAAPDAGAAVSEMLERLRTLRSSATPAPAPPPGPAPAPPQPVGVSADMSVSADASVTQQQPRSSHLGAPSQGAPSAHGTQWSDAAVDDGGRRWTTEQETLLPEEDAEELGSRPSPRGMERPSSAPAGGRRDWRAPLDPELRSFLCRAGLEDVLGIVALACGSLVGLLASPTVELRSLRMPRARLQRLLQVVAMERGRRDCARLDLREQRKAAATCEPAGTCEPAPQPQRAASIERAGPAPGTPGTPGLSRSSTIFARERPLSASERRPPSRAERPLSARQGPAAPATPSGDRAARLPAGGGGAAVRQLHQGVPPLIAVAEPAEGGAAADAPLWSTTFTAAGDELSGLSVSGTTATPRRPVREVREAASPRAAAHPLPPRPASASGQRPLAQVPPTTAQPPRRPASAGAERPCAPPPLPREDDILGAALRRELRERAAPAQEPPAPEDAPPEAADQSPEAARARNRQVRIREFLRWLEVPQCPVDASRIAARQRRASQRHVQTQQPRPPSQGSMSPMTPSSGFRQSRSLMDLLYADGSNRRVVRSGPIPVNWLDKLVSRLPCRKAKAGEDCEEPCTICLGLPEPGEQLTTLPCAHWYHRDCIREWLGHSRLCPLCKGSAVPDGVEQPPDP